MIVGIYNTYQVLPMMEEQIMELVFVAKCGAITAFCHLARGPAVLSVTYFVSARGKYTSQKQQAVLSQLF